LSLLPYRLILASGSPLILSQLPIEQTGFQSMGECLVLMSRKSEAGSRKSKADRARSVVSEKQVRKTQTLDFSGMRSIPLRQNLSESTPSLYPNQWYFVFNNQGFGEYSMNKKKPPRGLGGSFSNRHNSRFHCKNLHQLLKTGTPGMADLHI
jgi:hypothetical protein